MHSNMKQIAIESSHARPKIVTMIGLDQVRGTKLPL